MDSRNSLIQLVETVKDFVRVSKKPLKDFSAVVVGQ